MGAAASVESNGPAAAPSADTDDSKVSFFEQREMLGTIIKLCTALLPEHALEVCTSGPQSQQVLASTCPLCPASTLVQ